MNSAQLTGSFYPMKKNENRFEPEIGITYFQHIIPSSLSGFTYSNIDQVKWNVVNKPAQGLSM